MDSSISVVNNMLDGSQLWKLFELIHLCNLICIRIMRYSWSDQAFTGDHVEHIIIDLSGEIKIEILFTMFRILSNHWVYWENLFFLLLNA